MINEPSVDSMIRKLGTKEEPVSRYALCTVASKRARQIIEEEETRASAISPAEIKNFLPPAKISTKAE